MTDRLPTWSDIHGGHEDLRGLSTDTLDAHEAGLRAALSLADESSGPVNYDTVALLYRRLAAIYDERHRRRTMRDRAGPYRGGDP